MTDAGPQREVRADFGQRDPLPLLDVIRQTHGRSYAVVQRYPQGAWGAWLVADASGGVAVLKCVWDTDWIDRLELAGGVVDRLRERGAAVPRFLEYGYDAAIGTWYLQERVEGAPLPQLTSAVLPEVLDFVDLMADVSPPGDTSWNWSADVARVVASGSAPHDLLSRAGPATAAIASAAAGLVDAAHQLPTVDAVHGDFLCPQILVDSSHRLVGVIDWDEAAYGSRAIDLALLFQNVEVQADRTSIPVEPAVVGALAHRGLAIAGDGFVAAVHYHLVKMLSFVVAKSPAHVEWRLNVARRVLRNLATARASGK